MAGAPRGPRLGKGEYEMMDAEQRAAEGRRIAEVRGERGWSQKELAQRAGVAPNTVGSIERGGETQAGKLAAVRKALGLAPLATVQEEHGYPQDIQIIRDMIGMWMLGVPQERRAEYAAKIIRAILDQDDAYPQDIQVIRDVIGASMLDVPQERRAQYAAKLRAVLDGV